MRGSTWREADAVPLLYVLREMSWANEDWWGSLGKTCLRWTAVLGSIHTHSRASIIWLWSSSFFAILATNLTHTCSPCFFLSWQKKNRMKTETAVISSNVYFFYSKKQGNLSLKSPGLCILKKIIKLLVIWKNNPILENLWDPAFEVFSNEAWCLVWEKGWIYELHLKCSVALRKWDRPQTAISVLVVHVNLRK